MNTELLKNICAVKGTSGAETKVAEFILGEIEKHIDDYIIDPLGNLIAHKKGNGKKMMLAGHMDQIGMLVNYIDNCGFLYFSPIGGLTPNIILGSRVVFDNGIVGVISNERFEEPAKLTLEKMYIDIGAKTREEAEKLVKVGDTCVYFEQPIVDDFKIVTPALDDRVGCLIMIEALKNINNLKYDLYLVFTVQEELGLRGARAAAYTVDPDYGLAFDVTLSADTPKCKKLPMKMGDGACIKLKDASLICHPVMVRHMEKCAKDGGIKHQFEILEAGGTDSGAIHISKGGVPSGCISIATRYIHSMNEMARLSDIQDAINLTVKILETEITE